MRISVFNAVAFTTSLTSAWAAENKAASAFAIPEETQILLDNHCLDCHDNIEQKGDISLDNIAVKRGQ